MRQIGRILGGRQAGAPVTHCASVPLLRLLHSLERARARLAAAPQMKNYSLKTLGDMRGRSRAVPRAKSPLPDSGRDSPRKEGMIISGYKFKRCVKLSVNCKRDTCGSTGSTTATSHSSFLPRSRVNTEIHQVSRLSSERSS